MKNLISFLFIAMLILTSFTVISSSNEVNNFDNVAFSEFGIDGEFSQAEIMQMSALLKIPETDLIRANNRGCLMDCWNAYMSCQMANPGGGGGCFTLYAECVSSCHTGQ